MSALRLNDYEKAHLESILEEASECAVLLKKKDDFPLEKPGRIALYGSGARRTIKGGTGSGDVNSRFDVNIEEGLKRAGFIITTKDWLDAYDRVKREAVLPWIRRLRKEARAARQFLAIYGMGAVMPEPTYDLSLEGKGDTAVYVLSRVSGEGSDRRFLPGDFLLTKTEIRDILACQAKYRHFMLVLNVGGPVDLSPVADQVENILLLSQLGSVTGQVFARILLGIDYPSGKLTTSWAGQAGDPKIGDFAKKNDTRYREGIYVGYRFYDTAGQPVLFPFGYGIGYSEFRLGQERVSVDPTGHVSLEVRVKNTGDYPGKETVQIYLSSPDGKLDKPYQELAAFAKSGELPPKGEALLHLEFELTDLASYDSERECYLLEKGLYLLRMGTNSRDTRLIMGVELEHTCITRRVKNLLGTVDFTDWKPEKADREPLPKELPLVKISGREIACRTISYERKKDTDPLAESLSNEELALLTTGDFNPNALYLTAIGEASVHVSGAAGETSNRLRKKGLKSLIMADGPAGLRLNPHYVVNRGGTVSSYGQNPMIDSMGLLLPKVVLWWMRRSSNRAMRRIRKSGMTVYDQFATAIPIGTAIAQTWNLPLAVSWGAIVGDEMERFGIHLWLAPALNIHRNVRCGRNFEYYSEDPLISGKFAAAITRGVQQNPGCGTTIKHFAANNQETNRYGNNSMVSERAMREIYLRGFDICIRESQPCALMTSYNLLNGVHTSCSRALNEDILRSEFGFEGIVMTDWLIERGTAPKRGKYPSPDPALVAAAGNDLFMPGSRKDYQRTLAGLAQGRVRREDLLRDASRLIRMIKRLTSEADRAKDRAHRRRER